MGVRVHKPIHPSLSTSSVCQTARRLFPSSVEKEPQRIKSKTANLTKCSLDKVEAEFIVDTHLFVFHGQCSDRRSFLGCGLKLALFHRLIRRLLQHRL